MEYRQFGYSGLRVPLIGLGGNTFGKHLQFGKFNDQAATTSIINRAEELGVNFIDTGDIYAAGESERYIGHAIAGKRSKFIIASKVGLPFGDGPNDTGLSRFHIMNSIEGSLTRLHTDYVDIYYAHRPDLCTPIEETLRAFDDLVRQGKVRYVGCSNYSGWQIAHANQIAKEHHYASFAVSQSPYNLIEREIESEIVPACSYYGMSIVAYWPLAQGVLAGRYRADEPISPASRAWQNPSKPLLRQLSRPNLRLAGHLAEWANRQGHLPSELAIAWLASKPYVCSILIGVTSIEQLSGNVQALGWTLTERQVIEIDEMVAGSKDSPT